MTTKKRKMSKVLSLIAIFSLVATALAGCGGSENSSAGTKGDNTITWLTARPENGAIIQTVRELADRYSEDHPEFKLDIQVTADRPSYLTKLRTLVASGELPDFIDTDADPYAQELADAGMLVDMKQFLEEQGLYDQFYEPALKYQELPDGSLYLLPLEYHLEMTWYNKKIFEENNLTVPKTIDDMLTISKALKDKGITPIAVDGVDVWPVLRYAAMIPFRTTGNEFARNLSQGKAKMADDVGMQAANFVSEIGQYFQKGFASTDYTTAKNMFLNGEAAMYRMGTWEIPSFVDENLPEQLKGQVDYFYLPTINDAKTPDNEFFGNSGIGLAATTNNFDETTKDFLSYVLKNYSDVYVAKQQMSPLKFTIEDESKYSELFLRIKKDMDHYGSEFAKPWDTLLDADTNSVMSDLIIKLAMGTMTPEDFAKQIDDAIAQNASN
ncbi:extracellular solute-binding protein [Paenibacillus sp. FSL H8-0457]|uniref:ABC transporter substrate-binding protein n=1 Tax=Paenibacillus TaxID=44249 RepID=UPI0003E29CC4|nr:MULTISPECIES: extracellular solute-binding protein [Paenibacillus]ETT62475.1 family 1 extracellular solute-binding protein [Paenibacillus sp. FSL H8-457]MCM3257354.1 extracellular solute-binding protein [Paenibacillus lautus]